MILIVCLAINFWF